MAITYRGYRSPQGSITVTIAHIGDGPEWGETLPHLLRHSPDGFNWGYCGSGPAELARCILLHALPGRDADRLYQDFKRAHVAHWGDTWAITQDQVREWAEAQRLLERAGVVG